MTLFCGEKAEALSRAAMLKKIYDKPKTSLAAS
jgi:hypothetical protein